MSGFVFSWFIKLQFVYFVKLSFVFQTSKLIRIKFVVNPKNATRNPVAFSFFRRCFPVAEGATL